MWVYYTLNYDSEYTTLNYMGVWYTWLFEIVGLLHLSTWDCMLHLTIYQRLCVCYISDTVSLLHLTICDVSLLHLTTWDCKYVTLNYMRLYVCYISDTVSLLHLTIWNQVCYTLLYEIVSLLHYMTLNLLHLIIWHWVILHLTRLWFCYT